MFKKNNKLELRTYLQNYDNVYRYNICSIYNIPKIKKIYIQSSLVDFIEASDFYLAKGPTDAIKIKSVAFFYILLNKFPKILFQSIKSTKTSRKINDGNFILAFSTTDSKEIDNILSKIVGETRSLYSNIKNSLNKKKYKDIFSYNCKILGNSFFEVNDFFESNIQDINLKRVYLDISVVFMHIPKNCNLKNFLKTLFIKKSLQ